MFFHVAGVSVRTIDNANDAVVLMMEISIRVSIGGRNKSDMFL